eukprot:scaffold313581_cov36-Tisochrysis_lutea.AAC.2
MALVGNALRFSLNQAVGWRKADHDTPKVYTIPVHGTAAVQTRHTLRPQRCPLLASFDGGADAMATTLLLTRLAALLCLCYHTRAI